MTAVRTPKAAAALRTALLLLTLLLIVGCSAAADQPLSGTPGPEPLRLTLLDGSTLELTAGQSGHAIWLNFWAGWCRPCLEEWPAINDAAAEFSPQLQIIAVNVNQPAEEVAVFVAQHPAAFNVALDPDGRLAARFAVSGLPTHVLIGHDGTVRHVVRGPLDGPRAAALLGLTTSARSLP